MHQGYVKGDWQYKCENCKKGFDSWLVYVSHWSVHKLRKIGAVAGSVLMVGMTFGSAEDSSRRSDSEE